MSNGVSPCRFISCSQCPGRKEGRKEGRTDRPLSRPITEELQESIESSANVAANVAATKCDGFSTKDVYTLSLRIIMQMLKSPIL